MVREGIRVARAAILADNKSRWACSTGLFRITNCSMIH